MKHKSKRSGAILCAFLISTVTLQGCKADLPIPEDTVFTNGYHSTSPETHCYLSYLTNEIEVLEFASMANGSLCSKPNCNHTDDNCIMHRLSGNVPMLSDGYVYYFVNDEAEYYQNDDGKTDLKLGAALCCYNLHTGKETQMLHLAGYTVSGFEGCLLHDSVIYFIGNGYSRFYDENDIMLGYGSSGGELTLHAVRLSDGEVTDYGSLYDVDALSEYYPKAPNSGEVYMAGLFENKIYFNVGFVVDDETVPGGFRYQFYVTYYDLETGTYHGTPEDYTNIDFAFAEFLSGDYLVICRNGQATIYRSSLDEPVVLTDDCFRMGQHMSVFDDILICDGKAFDLNTGTVTMLQNMENKLVLARYGDDYIISESGRQAGFEKIPVTNLLPK